VGSFPNCQRFDASACRIDRVTWDVDAGAILEIETVVDVAGAFSPSIDPTGSWIAYDTSTSGSSLDVVVQSLTTSEEIVVHQGDKSNWRSETELLFGTKDENPSTEDRWNDLGQATLNLAPLGLAGPLARLLGAKNPSTALDSTNCSADDPFTNPQQPQLVALHNSPYWVGLPLKGAHTCPWMQGVPNFDNKNPQPVVVDLNATSWKEGESFWRFALEQPSDFPGCAHLAYSPDGKRILCTNQPTFHYESHKPPTGPGYDIGFNRIYGFELESVGGVETWVSVRGKEPMFDHPHPSKLTDIDKIWDQSDGRTCDTYYTKRAEFCGSSDRVIANVYCSPHEKPGDALFARVMLIEFSDPDNPVYTDLTSAIEDAKDLTRGSLGAFSAACK